MIDTIIIRIHNLDNYPQLKTQLYETKKSQTKGITHALIDTETAEFIREITYKPTTIYHDTNRILQPLFSSSINIASSHYSIAFKMDSQKNYCEFNFSIPKLIYSTNIFQFVNEVDTTAEATFTRMQLFFDYFFKKLIQAPKYEDVEINRIDLCYNQFFNNKSEALQYLEAQKQILAKIARTESKNNSRHYGTSLMYVTNRYSFKIYHKGTEFIKHDLKQLMKRNLLNLDLPYLIENSERILRYEYTFRNSQLNYLFKHYFLQSKKQLLYAEYSEHNFNKIWRSAIDYGFFEIYNNYMRTSKFFTLKSIYDKMKNNVFELFNEFENHNTKVIEQKKEFNYKDTLTFDSTFFGIIYKTFWQKVEQFQLDTVINVDNVKEKIEKLNNDRKKRKELNIHTDRDKRKLDEVRLLAMSLYCRSGGKIYDLKQYLPKSTYERLQRNMKSIGITDNQTVLNIPKPKLDYFDYRITLGSEHRRLTPYF